MGNDLADFLNEALRPLTTLDPTDYVTKTDEQACSAEANTYTTEIDNKTRDLYKNWNPSGIYKTTELEAVYKTTQAMMDGAIKVLDAARAEPLAQGDRDALMMARTNIELRKSISTIQGRDGDAMKWWNAITTAKQKGIEYIDAPGFKRWVINSMTDASQGIFAVKYVLCMRPWFVNAMNVFMTIFNAAYAIARAIVGTTIDFVKSVGKTMLSIPDLLSTAVTIGKWGVIAGVAYYFYKGEHKKLLGKF
jgi:hypothetical protein